MDPGRPTLTLPGLATPEATARLEVMLRALQAALRRAMELGPDAARDAAFHDHLDAAYVAYDAWIRGVAAHNDFTCGRGCSACCHDNPHGIAGVEILRLRRRLQRDGRWEALGDRMRAAGVAYAEQAARLGDAEAMVRQRALGRPCPLLDEGGACSVYADRPVACRMFHALTPADWCDPRSPRFAERENPHLLPPAVCLQILGAISRCLDLPPSVTLWEGLASGA